MSIRNCGYFQQTLARFARLSLSLMALDVFLAAASATTAKAEMTVLECAGTDKATNRASQIKLPAKLGSKVFAVDAAANLVLQRMDDKWTVLDEHAEVSDDEISARYSRDYPDGRIDIAFELDRATNAVVYLLDIDERPGEFFSARCKSRPPNGD